MYEQLTFEEILARMLARAPADMDKREGSVLWSILAPAALEIRNLYVDMDALLDETFADTAGRDFLIRRAAERGIKPVPDTPTHAQLRGIFNVDIPLDSRFSLDSLNYRAVERLGTGVFRMECETPGAIGNERLGTLTPIEYIDGLQTAELTEVILPGEEEEETEKFRKRYLQSFRAQAFGGNVADYKEKIGLLAGVGGVKVEPVWNGGGTVRCTILSADNKAPSDELLAQVGEAIDPVESAGEGLGIAPIGHKVTVRGVREEAVQIAVTLSFREGWSWEAVEPYAKAAADQYFAELTELWAESDALIVRVSQLETRLLALDGVLDASGLTLNAVPENLTLAFEAIPMLGGIACA